MREIFLFSNDGQIDRLLFTGRLLLVGATNRPQELDDGARRRLAKQLYIPLPCADARRAIVTNILDADESVSLFLILVWAIGMLTPCFVHR